MGVTLGLAQAPSMIALGPLDKGDERGEGQGHYSSRLGLEPGTDTMTRQGQGDKTQASTAMQGKI